MSMSRKIRFAGVLFGLLAVLTMATVAGAQTSNGTLVGAVTDQTGAVVPNVNVKVESPQFGAPREATTDSVGTYRMEGLQPGTYDVTFTAPGLAALRVGGVVINGSATTTVNGLLQVGTVQSTVTVEAGANQVIDTQSGQMAGNISPIEVTSLPYATFNPAELAMTLPGVQDLSPATTGLNNGVGYSVNGTRPRANNFLIDSVDDNDYGITGQAYQPDNVGAIQEVTILTNSYTAEYGRGGGSVLNYIYKSGSNSFHGQAWEINENSAFAANPAQNKIIGLPNPYSNENTYGYTIGGPALKDKLFFFASDQWDPSSQLATGSTLVLPTAAGIATLKGLDNPNANLFVQSLGGLVAPTVAGSPTASCLVLGSAPGSNVDRGCVAVDLFAQNNVPVLGKDTSQYYRVDFHPGPNDTISAGYIRNDSALSPDFFANPSALPPFITQQGGPSQIFHAQWVHTVSTNIVNELRYSYTNIGFTFAPTSGTLAGPLADLPNLVFDQDLTGPTGAALELGIDQGFPQGRQHKTSQIQEALTYTHGRHTIKGGVDVTFVNVQDLIPFDNRGSIDYKIGGNFTDATTTGVYSSLANFIDDFTGPAGSINKVFGSPAVSPSITMYAPYVTDTFRFRDNLTFTFGLRYEYWGTASNVLQFPALNTAFGFGVPGAVFPNMYAFKQQPDRNNFGPRLGFAYSPKWGKRFLGDGATVIRGGYGIYYDGLFTNIVDNTAATSPNAFGGSIVGGNGRGQADAQEQLGNIVGTPSPTAVVDTISNKLVNPYTQQWNLNVQRELPAKLILTVAYVGTRGEKLFVNQDFNGAVGFNPDGSYARLNPNFNEIAVRTNAAQSWYNAAQVEVERSLGRAFTMRASYTWSHLTDDASDVFTETGGSSFAQNLECQKCDWGNSALDRRNRLSIAYVWALPYNKSNRILKALTDQWQWSQITAFDSGAPDTVYDDQDINEDGHGGNDRPVLSNPKEPITATGFDGSVFGISAPGTFFPIAACFTTPICNPEPESDFRFVIPAFNTGFNGNVRRNSLYGPGQIYSDQSIQRTFPFHIGKFEGQSIMFRTEFFNAFNHPNLFTPTYNLLSPIYAQTGPTINGGRTIKFWLMYQF
jgi:hypothetical protein